MNEKTDAPGVYGWIVWGIVVLAAGIGFVCAGLLSVWLLPRGHEAVWQWALRDGALVPLPWTAPAAIILIVLGLVCLDTLRSGEQPSAGRSAALVVCLTCASGGLMLAMAVDDEQYPYRASAAVLGDMSMGYYLQAARIDDVREWVGDVEGRTTRGGVPERVGTHPPGPTLYYWAARNYLLGHPRLLARLTRRLELWSGDEGLQASRVLAARVSTFEPGARDIAISFWAALALTLTAPLVVPVMFTMGLLAGGRRLALLCGVLASAVPSLVCFNPSVDGLAAVVGCAVMLCWMWGLRSRHWAPGVLCGLVWAGGLFWTFGLLALAGAMGLLTIVWWAEVKDRWSPLRLVAGVTVALVAAALVGMLALGYDPISSLLRSLAFQSLVMQQRPRNLSIIWNLYEFALFAGPSAVLAALAGTLMGLSGRLKPRIIAGIGISLIGTLLVLALSARTRGEVGRIWGFLMPLALIPASLPVLRLRGWGLMSAGMLLLAGQLAVVVAMNCYLQLVAP